MNRKIMEEFYFIGFGKYIFRNPGWQVMSLDRRQGAICLSSRAY
jgi:hypothetical protein